MMAPFEPLDIPPAMDFTAIYLAVTGRLNALSHFESLWPFIPVAKFAESDRSCPSGHQLPSQGN